MIAAVGLGQLHKCVVGVNTDAPRDELGRSHRTCCAASGQLHRLSFAAFCAGHNGRRQCTYFKRQVPRARGQPRASVADGSEAPKAVEEVWGTLHDEAAKSGSKEPGGVQTNQSSSQNGKEASADKGKHRHDEAVKGGSTEPGSGAQTSQFSSQKGREPSADKKKHRQVVRAPSDWLQSEDAKATFGGWGLPGDHSKHGGLYILRVAALAVGGVLLAIVLAVSLSTRFKGKRLKVEMRPLPTFSFVQATPAAVETVKEVPVSEGVKTSPSTDVHSLESATAGLSVKKSQAAEQSVGPEVGKGAGKEAEPSVGSTASDGTVHSSLRPTAQGGEAVTSQTVEAVRPSSASQPATASRAASPPKSQASVSTPPVPPQAAALSVLPVSDASKELNVPKSTSGDSGAVVEEVAPVKQTQKKSEHRDAKLQDKQQEVGAKGTGAEVTLQIKSSEDAISHAQGERHDRKTAVHDSSVPILLPAAPEKPAVKEGAEKGHHQRGIVETRQAEKGAKGAGEARGVQKSDRRGLRLHAGEGSQLKAPWSSKGLDERSAAVASAPSSSVVPASSDRAQTQALQALQKLKVVDATVDAHAVCTKRAAARWLVTSSEVLSRGQTARRVFPAVIVGHHSAADLAFDDVTPADPDFGAIQGLAEAGLIQSRFTNAISVQDDDFGDVTAGHASFKPDSPVTRQEIISWKLALERRQLPRGSDLREVIADTWGFVDVERIADEALPAVAADLASGEDSIIARSFGYTLRLQPSKPVTNGQVASALAAGSATPVVEEAIEALEAERVADEVFQETARAEQEIVDLVTAKGEEIVQKIEAGQSALAEAQKELAAKIEALTDLKAASEKEREELALARSNAEAGKAKLVELGQQAEAKLGEVRSILKDVETGTEALTEARTEALVEVRRTRAAVKALEAARTGEVEETVEVREIESVDDWLRSADRRLSTGPFGGDFMGRCKQRVQKVGVAVRKAGGVVLQRAVEALSVVWAWLMVWWEMVQDFMQSKFGHLLEGSDGLRTGVATALHKTQKGSEKAVAGAKDGLRHLARGARDASAKLAHRFKGANV